MNKFISIFYYTNTSEAKYFGLYGQNEKLPRARMDDTKCARYLDKLTLVELGYGGSVLAQSQSLLLPQVPQKMKVASNVVKVQK